MHPNVAACRNLSGAAVLPPVSHDVAEPLAAPKAAREAQVAGSVTLLVLIDEAGRVLGTSEADAAPGGVYEQAAQQAVASSCFYPAQRDGRAVRSRILVKVEFDPAVADAAQ